MKDNKKLSSSTSMNLKVTDITYFNNIDSRFDIENLEDKIDRRTTYINDVKHIIKDDLKKTKFLLKKPLLNQSSKVVDKEVSNKLDLKLTKEEYLLKLKLNIANKNIIHEKKSKGKLIKGNFLSKIINEKNSDVREQNIRKEVLKISSIYTSPKKSLLSSKNDSPKKINVKMNNNLTVTTVLKFDNDGKVANKTINDDINFNNEKIINMDSLDCSKNEESIRNEKRSNLDGILDVQNNNHNNDNQMIDSNTIARSKNSNKLKTKILHSSNSVLLNTNEKPASKTNLNVNFKINSNQQTNSINSNSKNTNSNLINKNDTIFRDEESKLKSINISKKQNSDMINRESPKHRDNNKRTIFNSNASLDFSIKESYEDKIDKLISSRKNFNSNNFNMNFSNKQNLPLFSEFMSFKPTSKVKLYSTLKFTKKKTMNKNNDDDKINNSIFPDTEVKKELSQLNISKQSNEHTLNDSNHNQTQLKASFKIKSRLDLMNEEKSTPNNKNLYSYSNADIINYKENMDKNLKYLSNTNITTNINTNTNKSKRIIIDNFPKNIINKYETSDIKNEDKLNNNLIIDDKSNLTNVTQYKDSNINKNRIISENSNTTFSSNFNKRSNSNSNSNIFNSNQKLVHIEDKGRIKMQRKSMMSKYNFNFLNVIKQANSTSYNSNSIAYNSNNFNNSNASNNEDTMNDLSHTKNEFNFLEAFNKISDGCQENIDNSIMNTNKLYNSLEEFNKNSEVHFLKENLKLSIGKKYDNPKENEYFKHLSEMRKDTMHTGVFIFDRNLKNQQYISTDKNNLISKWKAISNITPTIAYNLKDYLETKYSVGLNNQDIYGEKNNPKIFNAKNRVLIDMNSIKLKPNPAFKQVVKALETGIMLNNKISNL